MMIFFFTGFLMCVPTSLTWVGVVLKDGAEAERSPAPALGSSQPTHQVLLTCQQFSETIHRQAGPRPFELFFHFLKNLFIFLAALGLAMSTACFSSCVQGSSSCSVPLIAASRCRAQILEHKLSSCTQNLVASSAYGIF